jgi:hypothetical protein
MEACGGVTGWGKTLRPPELLSGVASPPWTRPSSWPGRNSARNLVITPSCRSHSYVLRVGVVNFAKETLAWLPVCSPVGLCPWAAPPRRAVGGKEGVGGPSCKICDGRP